MQIDRLELYHFRSYDHTEAFFVPGVNLIVGDNAQGKTNLLEAISYLSGGKSFRTRREAELIQFGKGYAELNCSITNLQREHTMRMVLFAGRKPKQQYLNGVKKKTGAELSGILTTVLFCPEDLSLLKSGAASRRKFMDNALCQMRPQYAKAISEYQKLLDSKSRILKDRFEIPSLMDVLPQYNQRMAEVGSIIIFYRARFLESMAECAARFHEEFSGGREDLLLSYQTVSTITDPKAPVETIYRQLVEHQQSHYRAELESMQCLSGPHKDDFEVCLNERSVRAYGSQGQTRTAAISLKLAEREILKIDSGEEPVLLLDDVLSELDAGRQDYVLNKIKTGQVIITCCEKERFTQIGQVLTIEQGQIRKD